MATVKTLETEVALVKQDLNQMGSLFVKLEATLDKISDVCNNCTQILAVHEQRLHDGELQFNALREDMSDIEETIDSEIKDLHSRITTQHREMEEKMSKEIDKVLDAIRDLKSHMIEKHDSLEDRVKQLEKWRWIIIGILLAAGMFLPEIRSFLLNQV